MAVDPAHIVEIQLQAQRSRDGHQLLGLGHDGGHYYAPRLFIEETRPLGDAHTERTPSLATSATRMSPAFDAFDTSSVYSSSTDPPSLYGPEPVGLQRPAMPDTIPIYLPCEFEKLSGCTAVFSQSDKNLWIDHIIDEHLQGCCPKFSICWFCDGKPGKFRSTSNNREEKRHYFRKRMYHIAQHFSAGMTAADIRPDFHFLDHLYNHGLVDALTFEEAKSQGEFPNGHILQTSHDRVLYRERPREVYVEHARSTRRRR